MLITGTAVMMQRGAHNNIYMPTQAQQQAGLAAQAQLNHGYHTRSAAAQLAPGAGGAGPGTTGTNAQGYRAGSAPQGATRPW